MGWVDVVKYSCNSRLVTKHLLLCDQEVGKRLRFIVLQCYSESIKCQGWIMFIPDPLFLVDITALFFQILSVFLLFMPELHWEVWSWHLYEWHTKPIKKNISETQDNLGLITCSTVSIPCSNEFTWQLKKKKMLVGLIVSREWMWCCYDTYTDWKSRSVLFFLCKCICNTPLRCDTRGTQEYVNVCYVNVCYANVLRQQM